MRFRIWKPQNFQLPAVSLQGCNSPAHLLQAFIWRSVRHRHVKVNLMLFAKQRIAKPAAKDPPFRLPGKKDQHNNVPPKKQWNLHLQHLKLPFWGGWKSICWGLLKIIQPNIEKTPKSNSEFTPEKKTMAIRKTMADRLSF